VNGLVLIAIIIYSPKGVWEMRRLFLRPKRAGIAS
jgi:hypothetical protein